jgi:pimeloyl-ACP methyl ester carboxylesterase
MSSDRIHRATSDDGTEIAGRVHGQGPPLVLVPGAMSDGEFVWRSLLPLLTDHFEVFAMSTRGRGLSGGSTDLAPERLVQDVAAFVDSIGEPVALFGWSQGGYVALGAAEITSTVSAVAVFEPAVTTVMSQQVASRFTEKLTTMGALAAAGEMDDAARTFAGWLSNDDEMADSEALGLVTGWAANVPGFLGEVQQSMESEAPKATDPTELAAIGVPLLLMHGTRSIPLDWWLGGVRHVSEHVPDVHLCEIDGGGHFAPTSEPAAVADELVRFFAAIPALQH